MKHADILLWLLQILAWALACGWMVATRSAIDHFGDVADLGTVEWEKQARGLESEAHGSLSLAVIVPARNEERRILATLRALVQQDYAALEIIAVDDRSTDRTGRLMEAMARRHPQRLRVLHITELAPGWLGKTHAMALALQASESDYVLFTDADILFSPSVLRRAIAYAAQEQADHLVVAPTLIRKTRGESIMVGFFQFLAFTLARPWKVRDPRSMRDVIGIGAFNMVRRSALAALGGLAPQRMVIVEDLTLAQRFKQARLRSRIAFAPGLVLVHWAEGVRGLVAGLTKNLYAVCGFRLWLVLGAAFGLAFMFFSPLAMLAWKWTVIPGLLILLCIGALYKTYGEVSQLPARFAWTFPLGAALLVWSMLRSSAVVTWKRGVTWRGTFYPLRALKFQNAPWRWTRRG